MKRAPAVLHDANESSASTSTCLHRQTCCIPSAMLCRMAFEFPGVGIGLCDVTKTLFPIVPKNYVPVPSWSQRPWRKTVTVLATTFVLLLFWC